MQPLGAPHLVVEVLQVEVDVAGDQAVGQVLLGVEMMEEGALRDARLIQDLVDGGAGESLAQDQALGGVHDRGAGGGAVSRHRISDVTDHSVRGTEPHHTRVLLTGRHASSIHTD